MLLFVMMFPVETQLPNLRLRRRASPIRRYWCANTLTPKLVGQILLEAVFLCVVVRSCPVGDHFSCASVNVQVAASARAAERCKLLKLGVVAGFLVALL